MEALDGFRGSGFVSPATWQGPVDSPLCYLSLPGKVRGTEDGKLKDLVSGSGFSS